jgi:transcription antitermination protein NusB
MKARRVARELALLSLSQFGKNIAELNDKTIDDLVLNSIRTLSDYSYSLLKDVIPDLLNIKEYLDVVELNSAENLSRPIEADMLPAKIPDTKQFRAMVDSVLTSAEYILQAAEIVEMKTLLEQKDVKSYTIRIIKTFLENKETIDESINGCSEGWNIERVLKLDRAILRIAIVEIKFFNDVPNAVAADEAVELAKKYSTDDSPRFINGILGNYISNLGNSN